MLERVASRSNMLLDMYDDVDGSRRAEDAHLSKGSGFAEFQTRLKSIKDYHRKNPNEKIDSAVIDVMDLDEEEDDILESMFTGEEGRGRFFDMVELHEQYLNLRDSTGQPLVKRITYLAYLGVFDQFDDIPRAAKGEEYVKYLEALLQYIVSFYKRVKPLSDSEALQKEALATFDADWEAGIVIGWPRDESADTSLFCAACQKLYAKQSVYDAHLTSKKHIKAAQRLKESGAGASNEEMREALSTAKEQKQKIMAQNEALVKAFAQSLTQQRNDTKNNVERKQSLTERERMMEQEEEIEEEEIVGPQEDDQGDDDEEIYNPLKLPLGWDGRPIPYWLWKLHGLGVQYTCEICGNYVYMGRKAFDRHFQEARHSHSMKALGIPNSKHFQEITKIKDAFDLAERLKVVQKQDAFFEETMEEYEDDQGNVFNKKTYDDLKRQGLL